MKARKGNGFLSLCIFCILLCFCGVVFSQTVPEEAKAGEVEKALERQKEFESGAEKSAPIIELKQSEVELEIPEGKKIQVLDFEFRGNAALKTAYLEDLVLPYKGSELSLKELREICKEIGDAYKKKGYFLAHAYLPVQEIRDGVVVIEIIEGELGEVEIEGNCKEKFIRSHFRPAKKGVLNYDRLLKSLLVLNEYPDVKAAAILRKGKEPNTVDVLLKAEQKPSLHVALDYNNFGSRYVSRHYGGLDLDFSNLLFGGDSVSLRGVMGSPTDALFFGKAEYDFPINGYGTKAGISFIRSEFDVKREFKRLDANGESKIYGFSLTHPVTRTRKSSMDIVFGFDYKQIKNYLLGQINSDDELRVFKAGLSGDGIDSLNGRNYYSFLCTTGVKDIMGALGSDDPLASRAGAGGNFVKGNFDLARFQKFLFGSFVLFKCSGQAASDVLSVPEQFSVGGADTVRGFPQSELLGDYGYVGTLEWRFAPPFLAERRVPFTSKTKIKEVIQFVGFTDYGRTFRKNALAGESKNEDIYSAGIGARINLGKNIDVRVDLGFPIGGKEPSDGSDSTTYIQTITRF